MPLTGKPQFKDFRRPVYNFSDNKEIILLKNMFVKLIENEFYEKGKKLEIYPQLEKNLNFCINWVTGIDIDIKENKGIGLYGEIGLAKSAILKAVYKLVSYMYTIISYYYTANAIGNLFRKLNGESQEIAINKILYCRLLFIDDIGTEDKKVYDSYPIREIIRERYDKGRITCFSTNITDSSQMAEIYTSSIEDKMSHGAYRLIFEGKTRR